MTLIIIIIIGPLVYATGPYKLSTVTETAGDYKQGKFSNCSVRPPLL